MEKFLLGIGIGAGAFFVDWKLNQVCYPVPASGPVVPNPNPLCPLVQNGNVLVPAIAGAGVGYWVGGVPGLLGAAVGELGYLIIGLGRLH